MGSEPVRCDHQCHRPDDDEWSGWCDDCAGTHTANLVEVARSESICLWSDLQEAQQTAIRTDWSIKCGNLAERIVDLSRLVGAVPWQCIGVSTLRTGVYERVYTEAGIAYPPIDWQRVAEVEQRIAARSQP